MSLATQTFIALLSSTLVVQLVISSTPLAAALHADEAAARDLSGSWNLNTSLSQAPPRGSMDDGTRPTGRVGGGMGGGGGAKGGMGGGTGGGRPGGSPMGGGAGGGMDPERMRRSRETMLELMEAAEHLSISNDGNAVVVEAQDGSRERLVADGRKYTHALAAGDVTNRSEWKNGALRVETTTKDGMKVERRFVLEPVDGAPARLVITYIANMPMARRPMEARKVYDRAPE